MDKFYLISQNNNKGGMALKKFLYLTVGFVSGLINGILGTGGGTIVVPSIEALGTEVKKSHATAIAIILPITIVSAFFYIKQGIIDIKATLIVTVLGSFGALCGATILKKIPSKYLKILFGISMIFGGVKGLI